MVRLLIRSAQLRLWREFTLLIYGTASSAILMMWMVIVILILLGGLVPTLLGMAILAFVMQSLDHCNQVIVSSASQVVKKSNTPKS